MEQRGEITVIQAMMVVASTIIGVGVLHLPALAVREVGTRAPLIIILGLAITCIGIWFATLLGRHYPGRTIIQYGDEIIGKWLGKLFSVLLIVFFAILTSFAAREFGEVVDSFILPETPVEMTIVIMLLLAAISVRNSITTFAQIHYFYFPVIVVPALLILLLSFQNAEMTNILPIVNGTRWGPLFSGSLAMTSLLQGFFIMTIIIPALRPAHKAFKAGIGGVLIAGVLYLCIAIITIAVFGVEYSRESLWPFLEMARLTSMPANVLERLDAIFLIVWVIAVFTSIFSTYYFVVYGLRHLLQLQDHRLFSLFVLPFIFAIAMIPHNVLNFYQTMEVFGKYGLYLTILYPGVLLLIARIRKRSGGAG